MTQDDIKKALEICADISIPCNDCPYDAVGKCNDTLSADALKLIIEQEKEIERLKVKNKVLGDGVAKAFTNGLNTGRKQVEKDIRRAKINAMIELKEKIVEHMGEREYMGVKYKQGVFSESEIDELIKEVQNGKDKG